MIDALGSKAESIVVYDVKNDPFYAWISLNLAEGWRSNVWRRILPGQAFSCDQESYKSVLSEGDSKEATKGNQQGNKPASKKAIECPSAYADFIKTLNFRRWQA
jgi:hypothetical protein